MNKKTILFIFIFFAVLGLTINFFLNSYIEALVVTFLIMATAGMALNFITGVANQFSLGAAGFMAFGSYTSAVLSKQFSTISGISFH